MYSYLTLKNAYQLISYGLSSAYTSSYAWPVITYITVNAYPLSIAYPYYASAYVWWFAYYYYS